MYSEAKLREAKYFSDQLRQLDPADDEFAFHLSALVSSFRSVTFAMQFEYSKHARAAEIYGNLQEELKMDAFASAMRDARNDQQKQGHTWPRIVLTKRNEGTGVVIQFEAAPLPNGFDRFRGISVLTPPEKCLPLTGDAEKDVLIAPRQVLEGVLSMREGEWCRETLVKVKKDFPPMSLSDFFERINAWLVQKRCQGQFPGDDRSIEIVPDTIVVLMYSPITRRRTCTWSTRDMRRWLPSKMAPSCKANCRGVRSPW